jgi:deoxyribonuclease V
MWPTDAVSLVAAQHAVAEARPEMWRPSGEPLLAGCWVCFPRGLSGRGRAGDPAWSAVVVTRGPGVVEQAVQRGRAAAPYEPGLLALRLGPVMESAVRAVARPDVLLVDATSSDHPRRAGLARHLGAVLDLPTIGVTHRPLLARGEWPEDRTGATSPLVIGREVVGCWMRTRVGARPLAVHPGWRVDLATAVSIVASTTGRRRTPEPLRQARQLARTAREEDRATEGR